MRSAGTENAASTSPPRLSRSAPAGDETEPDLRDSDFKVPFDEPVVIELRDVIDLHSIPPAQIPAVVRDYLEEAHHKGFRWIRIMHGKGIGTQRAVVRSILSGSELVAEFHDAPPDAGGWGATIVTLRESEE